MSRPAYSQLVAQHFAQPCNAAPLKGADVDVFTGAAGSRERGTRVRFQARINAERIDEIAFQAYGCPHTIAACSLATERLTGQPARTLQRFDLDGLMAALQVPVDKTGRMLLLQDALHHCFHAWENRRLAST